MSTRELRVLIDAHPIGVACQDARGNFRFVYDENYRQRDNVPFDVDDAP